MTIAPAYDLSLQTFVPMLTNLRAFLEKGAEHARAKGVELTAMTRHRLAPDMFPLYRQVQLACSHAIDATSRLVGDPPEPLEVGEEELDALVTRIGATITELERLSPVRFDESRAVEMPLKGGLVLEMKAGELLRTWGLPNFYFHVVTAYDVLRHFGVDLGKRDFMAHLGPFIRQTQ